MQSTEATTDARPPVPEACPDCAGPVSWVMSIDRSFVVVGCFNSSGEHWNERRPTKARRAEIVIPAPLADYDASEPCFNGGCGQVVEFKAGRGYCEGCGVLQRVAS